MQDLTPFFHFFLAFFFRIDAIIAGQNQQYNIALKLLDKALVYYKAQAWRRSIAACLEEIAEIKFQQHNNQQALEYLKRALTIRVWLKDAYTTDKIQKNDANKILINNPITQFVINIKIYEVWD